MRVLVTVTQPLIAQALAALEACPGEVLRVPGGLRRTPGDVEILVPRARTPARDHVTVRLFRPPAALRRVSYRYWEAFDRRGYSTPTLDLALDGERGGSAAFLVGEGVLPVAEVRIVGPRMERWCPGVREAPEANDVPSEGRHSRYAGALGGRGPLARLQRLEAAAAGQQPWIASLAEDLARAGVGVRLIAGSRGRAARELADHLGRIVPEFRLRARWASAQGLAACRAADLLVSAGAEPEFRTSLGAAASAYLRPHLDLTCALVQGPRSRLGVADVRLMLPGEGCLACAAGLDPPEQPYRPGHEGRFSSLGRIASGQAMALLERLVAGDLRHSTWMRLVLEEDGRLSSEPMPWHPRAGCPVCNLSGAGDDALLRERADSGSAECC